MTTGMRYFLAVVQEQGISHAAQKLFVSQQALSEQMKRLEELYHTTLFIRKPRFALTPSGEALFRVAQKILILEDGLSSELDEIQSIGIGRLRVGIHSARARSYFPSVIKAFHAQYPLVDIKVIHDDTKNFEEMLLNGQLDLFLGVDTGYHPEFDYTQLGKEPIFLIASEMLLLQYLDHIPQSGLSLNDLAKLPLIVNLPSSNLRNKIDSSFRNATLTPRYAIEIEDFSVQMALAAQDIGACFCPEQIMRQLHPTVPDTKGRLLYCLPILDLSDKSQISLVSYKNAYRVKYFTAFFQIMQQVYSL